MAVGERDEMNFPRRSESLQLFLRSPPPPNLRRGLTGSVTRSVWKMSMASGNSLFPRTLCRSLWRTFRS